MKKTLKFWLITGVSIITILGIWIGLRESGNIMIDHSGELSDKNSWASKKIENPITYEEAVNKGLIYEDEWKDRYIDCGEYGYFSCELGCVPNDIHYEPALGLDENGNLSLEVGHERFCKKNYIQYLQANNLLSTTNKKSNNGNNKNNNWNSNSHNCTGSIICETGNCGKETCESHCFCEEP